MLGGHGYLSFHERVLKHAQYSALLICVVRLWGMPAAGPEQAVPS
jgi:hypothetical protein